MRLLPSQRTFPFPLYRSKTFAEKCLLIMNCLRKHVIERNYASRNRSSPNKLNWIAFKVFIFSFLKKEVFLRFFFASTKTEYLEEFEAFNFRNSICFLHQLAATLKVCADATVILAQTVLPTQQNLSFRLKTSYPQTSNLHIHPLFPITSLLFVAHSHLILTDDWAYET